MGFETFNCFIGLKISEIVNWTWWSRVRFFYFVVIKSEKFLKLFKCFLSFYFKTPTISKFYFNNFAIATIIFLIKRYIFPYCKSSDTSWQIKIIKISFYRWLYERHFNLFLSLLHIIHNYSLYVYLLRVNSTINAFNHS